MPDPRPCPICRKPATAPHSPFCSPRCRQVDLGRWLAGGYVVAGGPPEPEAEDEPA